VAFVGSVRFVAPIYLTTNKRYKRKIMPRARLELARLAARASKTRVAANYTISAHLKAAKFQFSEQDRESLARLSSLTAI
jgi:hypothetical protein